jgi:hypothetical protein
LRQLESKQAPQGQRIGIQLRQHTFTTGQTVINFINTFDNADQRLGVFEAFQQAVQQATNTFLESVDTVWTWVEHDAKKQTVATA